MTGRRLYELYCDTTESVGCFDFLRPKTALAHPDKPPVAWAYLLRRDRDVWNALAKRITPKRRPKPAAPSAAVWIRHRGERKIQAIKELRALTGLGLRESKAVIDYAQTTPFRLELQKGKTIGDARRALLECEVRDA
jgi:hypothetical protein